MHKPRVSIFRILAAAMGFDFEAVRIQTKSGLRSTNLAQREAPQDPAETRRSVMKRTIWAVTAIGLMWLLASNLPDLRRYLRMMAM